MRRSTSSSLAAAPAACRRPCSRAGWANEVIVLEKAPEIGGTTRKAAFWYWVPNNAAMRSMGTDRPEERLHPLHGAPVAAGSLRPADIRHSAWANGNMRCARRSTTTPRRPPNCSPKRARLNIAIAPTCRTIGAELPEDKAPKGRVLLPKGACDTMSDGGEVAVRTMSETARRDGVEIRTGMRVQRVSATIAAKSSASRPTTLAEGGRASRPQGGDFRDRRLHP